MGKSKKRGRYWLFAFDGYYPSGGMNDFKFSFNDVEEFEDKLSNISKYDNYQVLDIVTHYHFSSHFSDMVKWVCKNVGNEGYEEDILY